MIPELSSSVRLVPPAIAAALLVALGLAGGSGAASPECASFHSQADAQDYFAELGGSPRKRVGALDDDRDGVACEELPAPFKGFATIGYNLKRKFFYGTVSMPPAASAAAGERLACLYGNRHFAEGPRRLRIYRVELGADEPVTEAVAAEARPADNRLIWKADKQTILAGRYYAEFEARVPISPYGPNQCPGFRSAEVALPPALAGS